MWISREQKELFIEKKAFFRIIQGLSFGEKKMKITDTSINPNKTGLYEVSFFRGEGGGQFDPPSYFKKN